MAFAYEYTIVVVPFVERTIVSLLNLYLPLLKISRLLYTCGSIAGPYSILLIYLCILMPHCLYYCGFMNLGIKFCKSFNFVRLFFTAILTLLESFAFPYEFGISLSMSTIKLAGNVRYI